MRTPGLFFVCAWFIFVACSPQHREDHRSTPLSAPSHDFPVELTDTGSPSPPATREPEPIDEPAVDGHQVTLPIPARKQAPESPSSGWCGETAIQEALLYFGAYVPQAKINAAGKPQHPDLYASDIPVALRNLGVDFDRYRNRGDDLDGFLTWLQARIRAGQPVLLGMKIHPTEHPQWGLDHFVLAVGFGEDDLLVNTTWGHQARRSRQQLGSTDKGLSLKNAYGTYWALPIRGWTDGETNARLTVRGESEGHVELEVSCTGLESGKRYELQRMSSLAARRPDDASDFVAEGATHDSLVRVARERTARFRCIPKV